MKGKIQAGVVGFLISAVGVLGLVETLQAAPDGSQRLRGMEGRAFLVEAFIQDENGEYTIPNPPGGSYCYIFNSGGEWIDERFALGGPPVPGMWEQHSVGAKTTYSASADAVFDIGFPLPVLIVQEGVVTPARGRGVLQLEALTDIFVFGEYSSTLLTIGYEIDIDDCPPAFPTGD